MSFIKGFRARVKAGKGPYAILLRIAKTLLSPPGLPVPSFLKPVLRMVYGLNSTLVMTCRFLLIYFVRQPLFQSRCRVVGRNLTLWGKMPFVSGPVEVELGDNVSLGGGIDVLSGGPVAVPRLVIKDRTMIGGNCLFSVGKEIIIEEDVIVSYDCRISDTDGHPKEADLRAQKVPPRLETIRPVRICRYAFVANGTHVMKGVTIGEGAVIGSNSVVMTDIPPYSLAFGNPAEVYFRNYGKPSRKA